MFVLRRKLSVYPLKICFSKISATPSIFRSMVHDRRDSLHQQPEPLPDVDDSSQDLGQTSGSLLAPPRRVRFTNDDNIAEDDED